MALKQAGEPKTLLERKGFPDLHPALNPTVLVYDLPPN